MPASRFMYFAGDRFSIAELSAASLDGHLVELGEGFMPADAVETPAMRAASLRPLIGDTMAASLLSAAWIWGAIDQPPSRHSAHRAVAHRLHHILDRRLVLHDVYLPEDTRIRVGGVWVSTPLHTLLALVRAAVAAAAAAPHEASTALAARAIVESGAADPADALAWLATRPRMPGKTAARAMLETLRGCAVALPDPASRR